jgi:hypothetical protein
MKFPPENNMQTGVFIIFPNTPFFKVKSVFQIQRDN